MIYLTGDTHGGVDMKKLSVKNLKRNGIELTSNDYLIITGDFGFPFSPIDIKLYEEGSGEYLFWINWFKERPYTILFIDGNHDNHDWWKKQEVTEMFGGRVQVHPHASNIIHLLRGEVYTIEGKSFFTFGGATSTDREWREEGVTWWAAEEASDKDIANAKKNLEKANYSVDYILTHTLPSTIIDSIPMFYHKTIPCKTASFLDRVYEKVDYKMWFCGHFHTDMPIYDDKMFVLYQSVTSLEIFEKVFKEEEDYLNDDDKIIR